MIDFYHSDTPLRKERELGLMEREACMRWRSERRWHEIRKSLRTKKAPSL
tara:strand:+ start:138 stop:287 length:150 start_codon:yes stop_codon:yes gene_type:complete